MLPANPVVTYPLAPGSSAENCPHCKENTLTEEIYTQSTKQTRVEPALQSSFDRKRSGASNSLFLFSCLSTANKLVSDVQPM